MSKVSLIIPTLRVNNMVDRCIESFKGQYDELIVVDDKAGSLAYKQNKGLRMATGDFLIVCNDDVVVDKGKLKDLCIDGQVTSPLVNGGVFKVFHGHMFCLPRNIYAEVGGFDESYHGLYAIDSDLWYRLHIAGYPPQIVDNVDIDHRHPASTIKTLDQKQRDSNEAINWFVSKWGEQARRIVKI